MSPPWPISQSLPTQSTHIMYLCFRIIFYSHQARPQIKSMDQTTQLQKPFSFWFQKFQKADTSDFKNTLHLVATIKTIPEFWAYYQHLKRPSQLEDNTYLYLFREGVKPIWEDSANLNGGSYVILTEKARSNRMWEDILLSFISSTEEDTKEITGIRLKIKKQIAHIDIWVGDLDDDLERLERIKKWVLQATGLKEDTQIQFLHFNTEG